MQKHGGQETDHCNDHWEENQPEKHKPRFPSEEVGHDSCALTVKLRGRTQVPDWSRGRTLSFRARSYTTALHGPLERLLGDDNKRFPCPGPGLSGGFAKIRIAWLQHQPCDNRQEPNVLIGSESVPNVAADTVLNLVQLAHPFKPQPHFKWGTFWKGDRPPQNGQFVSQQCQEASALCCTKG